MTTPKLTLTLRASAALPAAGAFDTTPTPVQVAGFSQADLHVWYTSNAGSPTGRPKLRVQFSCDAPSTEAASVGHWTDDILLDGTTLAKSAGWWSEEGGGLEVRLPTPGVANTQRCFRLTGISLAGVNWMRVFGAEHGDAANPGTLALFAVVVE